MLTIRPAFQQGFRTTTTCNCADVDLEEWFLAWDAHAVSHGQSPLISHVIEVPHAVNMMWNASVLLPGVLLAPVTRWAGPIATYNLLVLIGLAGSAFIATLVFRRWAPWWPAALTGGLLFGFSPYVISAGVVGHLHIILVLLLPLLLATLDDIFIRRRRRSWLLGLQLGLLVTAQLLISEEVLANAFVLTVIVGIIALAGRRAAAGSRLRAARPALFWAALVAAVTTGPLLLVQLTGPGRITSSAQPATELDPFSTDLLGPVVPTGNQHFTTAAALRVSQHFDAGYGGEQSAYLGATLILAILIISLVLRMTPVIRLHLLVGAAAGLLSLGSVLEINGRSTGIDLPFALLKRVSLVDTFVAARFSVLVMLSAAIILAVGCDRLARTLREPGRLHALARAGLAVLVLTAAALPVMPAVPLPATAVDVPSYFTGPSVATGVALVYPYPRKASAQAMVWQSAADFSFRMLGGYAVVPGPHGHGALEADVSPLEDKVVALHDQGTNLPVETPETFHADLAFLCTHQVNDLIIVAKEPGALETASFFTTLAGRLPDVNSGGVYAWNGITPCLAAS